MEAVRARKNAAGAQDAATSASSRFSHCLGRDMMKHSETHRPSNAESGKDMAVASWRTTVTLWPLMRRERELANARSISTRVRRSTRPRRRSVYARAGANFEDIRAYVESVKHPRKDVGLDRFSPICGAAEPAMSKVHGIESFLLKTV